MVENVAISQAHLAETLVIPEEIMTAEDLTQTLQKLHAELSGNPELDENTLSSLRTLLSEIQVAIDRATGVESPASSDESSLPVTDRLRSAISSFEARHPSLTLSLSKIADGLSSMGI